MQLPSPSKILFIDIETVPATAQYADLDNTWQQLWHKKNARNNNPDISEQDNYFSQAGILAEFGKIVCISVGAYGTKQNEACLKIKSYFNHNEKTLLTEFANMINISKLKIWVGHNIKEFDIPYIARRMFVHGIQLPKVIDIQNQKPWEVPHIDTLQLWKFGDYKHYTSLHLLSTVLGIESNKENIDGSMVGDMYWNKNNLTDIVKYCQHDVLTVANVYMRLNNLPLIHSKNIILAN